MLTGSVAVRPTCCLEVGRLVDVPLRSWRLPQRLRTHAMEDDQLSSPRPCNPNSCPTTTSSSSSPSSSSIIIINHQSSSSSIIINHQSSIINHHHVSHLNDVNDDTSTTQCWRLLLCNLHLMNISSWGQVSNNVLITVTLSRQRHCRGRTVSLCESLLSWSLILSLLFLLLLLYLFSSSVN